MGRDSFGCHFDLRIEDEEDEEEREGGREESIGYRSSGKAIGNIL